LCYWADKKVPYSWELNKEHNGIGQKTTKRNEITEKNMPISSYAEINLLLLAIVLTNKRKKGHSKAHRECIEAVFAKIWTADLYLLLKSYTRYIKQCNYYPVDK